MDMTQREFEICIEAFTGLLREGPGNNESTRKALQYLKDLPVSSNILDVGCGSGMPTIEIAKNLNCKITAIDVYPLFLEELNTRAKNESLSDKIVTLNKSMFEMDFEPESFDIIWAEGSIYIFGTERALKEWTYFLKKDGYLVFTECSWLTDHISPDLEQYWARCYPGMKTVNQNLEMIENSGLKIIGHFTLPENAWWDSYYNSLKLNLEKIRQKYGKEADKVIEQSNIEMSLYQNYSNEYGYEFFILQK